MAYNPFNAASGIVENKRKWANAKAKGEDTKPYEEGAAVYYKELRDNGRGDVADYLQKSDSITAGEYLKQLQPEYGVDAASLQKKSDNLYGVGVGTMDDISKTFDKVYDNNINVDPTSTGYGKNILSGYGIAANEAYKGTLGGDAENNGGNVDSFAAANANRQKAAILSQGYGDVLGYYNTIAGQANQWATNKGNTVGAYLAQLQGNVDADRGTMIQNKGLDVDLDKAKLASESEKYVADSTKEAGIKSAEIGADANMYGSYLSALASGASTGGGSFFGTSSAPVSFPAPVYSYQKNADGSVSAVPIVDGNQGSGAVVDTGMDASGTASNVSTFIDKPIYTVRYGLGGVKMYYDMYGNLVDASRVEGNPNVTLISGIPTVGGTVTVDREHSAPVPDSSYPGAYLKSLEGASVGTSGKSSGKSSGGTSGKSSGGASGGASGKSSGKSSDGTDVADSSGDDRVWDVIQYKAGQAWDGVKGWLGDKKSEVLSKYVTEGDDVYNMLLSDAEKTISSDDEDAKVAYVTGLMAEGLNGAAALAMLRDLGVSEATINRFINK